MPRIKVFNPDGSLRSIEDDNVSLTPDGRVRFYCSGGKVFDIEGNELSKGREKTRIDGDILF